MKQFCLQHYLLSDYALKLNEVTDELREKIAPTDSRRRSDVRRLEYGDIGVCLYFKCI